MALTIRRGLLIPDNKMLRLPDPMVTPLARRDEPMTWLKKVRWSTTGTGNGPWTVPAFHDDSITFLFFGTNPNWESVQRIKRATQTGWHWQPMWYRQDGYGIFGIWWGRRIGTDPVGTTLVNPADYLSGTLRYAILECEIPNWRGKVVQVSTNSSDASTLAMPAITEQLKGGLAFRMQCNGKSATVTSHPLQPGHFHVTPATGSSMSAQMTAPGKFWRRSIRNRSYDGTFNVSASSTHIGVMSILAY